MFEETRVELWQKEAVTLADVLTRLHVWLPGVLEYLEFYGARISERIASAEAYAAI